jgi:hypothetical protein
MVEFTVKFSISTALLSLDDLTNRLGEGGLNSHTIGVVDGIFWDRTEWTIDSRADADSGLEAHVESIWERLPLAKLKTESLPSDHRKVLDIAAFFDDPMNQINIGSQWLKEFAYADIDVEISCYPCKFDI